MCDTIVVTKEASADGVTLFGKNSDREPNEAHHVITVAAADHKQGSAVHCTYIDIPQVAHTNAVLLAKPFWIWGAEMGANEHGVAIGNEAVFTKIPYGKKRGLIGMDFLRLALERAATARQAVGVITGLLDQYGQSGNCGMAHESYYHNSFLIADPREAWVLETADKHWAAKQLHGVYSISNGLTIGREWDMASPNLVAYAIEKGWCKNKDDFDFARCYSDTMNTWRSAGRVRRQQTMDELSAGHGQSTVTALMAALRSHGPTSGESWSPDRGLTGVTVCMHASFGPVRGSQTTGSMVSHLHPRNPTHFVTASAAPCTSIFKPIWLGAELPAMGNVPARTYSALNLFWQHELLHRATLQDFAMRLHAYAAERDTTEQESVAAALALAACPSVERAAFSARAFAEAKAAETRWLEHIAHLPTLRGEGWLHRRAWKEFNKQAVMPK